MSVSGALAQSGPIRRFPRVRALVANAALTPDQSALVDTSAGAVTVTLPSAVGIAGRRVEIKKTTNDGNPVTLATTGGQTIDGQTGGKLYAGGAAVALVSDGANWRIDWQTNFLERHLDARWFGARCDNATDDYAAIQAMITEAQDRGGPTVAFIPSGGTKISQALRVTKVGVYLVGESLANSADALGTIITPMAGATAVEIPAAIYLPSAGNGGQAYYHGNQIRDLSVRSMPQHGVWVEGGAGELFTLDTVSAIQNSGHGIYLSGGGTPCILGDLIAHSNGQGGTGDGLLLAGLATACRINSLSGDDNAQALLAIESSDPSGSFDVGSVKIERRTAGKHNTPIRLKDLNGARVRIGSARFSHDTAVANSPASAVIQSRTAVTKAPGVLEFANVLNTAWSNQSVDQWPNFYEDQIAGDTVPWDAVRYGRAFSTAAPLALLPGEGRSAGHDVTITATVGVAQTAIPHDLGVVPTITAIIPRADARVWRSQAADASSIYLTASVSVVCDIVLSGIPALAAAANRVQYDTFTAADGTNISGRAPDVGTAWTISAGTWLIQGNAAEPSTNFAHLSKDVSAADARIRTVVNLGNEAVTRAGGLAFRKADNTNFWYFLLQRQSSGAGFAYLFRVDANSHTLLKTQPVTVNPSTDYTLEVAVQGKWAICKLDGVRIFRWYVGDFNPSATSHSGCYITARGTASPFVRFSSAEVLT